MKKKEDGSHHLEEYFIELRPLHPIRAEPVRILGNHIIGEGPEHGQQLNHRPILSQAPQPCDQLLHVCSHDRLQPPHALLAEHLAHRRPPRSVHVMVGRRACRLGEAEDLDHARVLVPATAPRGHQLGEEGWVIDVEFVGRDAHDGAVAGVHVADAEQVLAAEPEVVVEFVPERDRGKARARKPGQWVEEEAAGVESSKVEEEGGGKGGDGPCCDDVDGGGGSGGDVEGCHRDDCCSRLCPWDEDSSSWIMLRPETGEAGPFLRALAGMIGALIRH